MLRILNLWVDLLLLGALAGGCSREEDPLPVATSWRPVHQPWTWHNPRPQGDNLLSVWGASGSDVFAVGESGTVVHYDGAVWTVLDCGSATALQDVWGVSGTDVYIVGYGGQVLHHDGTGWTGENVLYFRGGVTYGPALYGM